MCISPERELWAGVVWQALLDALYPIEEAEGRTRITAEKLQREAHEWFAGNCNDFRAACYRAGYDADFVRDRYLAGAISYDGLKRSVEASKAGAAA